MWLNVLYSYSVLCVLCVLLVGVLYLCSWLCVLWLLMPATKMCCGSNDVVVQCVWLLCCGCVFAKHVLWSCVCCVCVVVVCVVCVVVCVTIACVEEECCEVSVPWLCVVYGLLSVRLCVTFLIMLQKIKFVCVLQLTVKLS